LGRCSEHESIARPDVIRGQVARKLAQLRDWRIREETIVKSLVGDYREEHNDRSRIRWAAVRLPFTIRVFSY
jgi:hypothetical protein